jgi:hypothetical protein
VAVATTTVTHVVSALRFGSTSSSC